VRWLSQAFSDVPAGASSEPIPFPLYVGAWTRLATPNPDPMGGGVTIEYGQIVSL